MATLASSWRKPSQKKLARMESYASEAYRLFNKLESEAEENGDMAYKEYDAANGFFKAAMEFARQTEPGIAAVTEDSFFGSDNTGSTNLFLGLDAAKDMPGITLAMDLEGNVTVWAEGDRQGMALKRFENLANAFLSDEDEIGLLGGQGKGSDATFEFCIGLDFSREDIARQGPRFLADKIVAVFRKTKEFSNLIKANPDLTINDLRPVPQEFLAFENFGKELYAALAEGAVKGIDPMPMLSDRMAWGKDMYTLEMSFPLAGPVFLLKVSCTTGGYLEMAFYGYRYGSTIKVMKDNWAEISEERYAVKGTGKGASAWFVTAQAIDSLMGKEDLEETLNSLSPRRCLMDIGKFYKKVVRLAKALKGEGNIDDEEAENQIEMLRAELATSAPESDAKDSTEAAKATAAIATELKVETESTSSDPDEESEEDQEEDTADGVSTSESQIRAGDLSSELKSAFKDFASALVAGLKSRAEMKDALSGDAGEPELADAKIEVVVHGLDSAPSLRISYRPAENAIAAGWEIGFEDSMAALYEDEGERMERSSGAKFEIDEDAELFCIMQNEECHDARPHLAHLEKFVTKVARMYEPVRKLSRKVAKYMA